MSDVRLRRECQRLGLGSWVELGGVPALLTRRGEAFPYGIVATCELVDVVPIIAPQGCEWHIEHPRSVGACAHAAIDDQVILHTPEGRHHTTVLVENPYGDFTPGRFAWLLDDIRPVDPPVPCRGRQGLWNVPDDVLAEQKEQAA